MPDILWSWPAASVHYHLVPELHAVLDAFLSYSGITFISRSTFSIYFLVFSISLRILYYF